MGTVTEEIISESDREAVGEGGAGAGGNSGFMWPFLGLRVPQCGKITGMQTNKVRQRAPNEKRGLDGGRRKRRKGRGCFYISKDN